MPFSQASLLVDETPQRFVEVGGEQIRQDDVRMHEWFRIRGSSVVCASSVRVMSESSSLPASSPPSTKRSLASVGAAPPLRTCWVCASKVAEVLGQTGAISKSGPLSRAEHAQERISIVLLTVRFLRAWYFAILGPQAYIFSSSDWRYLIRSGELLTSSWAVCDAGVGVSPSCDFKQRAALCKSRVPSSRR